MSSATHKAWPLATPRIRIAPSLLAADFARLADDVAKIEAAGAEILHLDIMDGHFVPKLSFGIPVIEKLRKVSRLLFDTHLMITDPVKYAEPFIKAGSDLLTFHIEVAHEPLKVVDHIRAKGARVGVSLNPGTEVPALRGVIAAVDMVLVMSVWPGFGGQKFMPTALERIRSLRPQLRADQRLEVDGGIGIETVRAVAEAGADTLVAGSAVFGQPDPGAAMQELERLAGQGPREPRQPQES